MAVAQHGSRNTQCVPDESHDGERLGIAAMTDINAPITHIHAAFQAGRLRTSPVASRRAHKANGKCVKLSKACRDGKHYKCFCRECNCSCGHGGGA